MTCAAYNAGSGNFQICDYDDGVGALANLDIDPSIPQYFPRPPTDHKHNALPIYQGYDLVTWEFEAVSEALVDQFTTLEGQQVYIRTRLRGKHTYGVRKAILDEFYTDVAEPNRIFGRATFIKVEVP